MASGGEPIELDGRTVHMSYVLGPVPTGVMTIRMRPSGELEQGVGLSAEDGWLTVAGEKTKTCALWTSRAHPTAPSFRRVPVRAVSASTISSSRSTSSRSRRSSPTRVVEVSTSTRAPGTSPGHHRAMTSTHRARPRSSQPPWTTIALVLLVAPVLAASTMVALLLGDGLGLVLPFAVVAVLVLYRATVRSTHSEQTRASAREVGAVVLALGLGLGTSVAAIFVGIATGIVPFLTESPHPWSDAWWTASTVAATLSLPAWWALLRRWADPRVARRDSAF